MSQENLQKFIKEAGRDPGVEKALRGSSSKGHFADTAVSLGAQKGYSFSAADVDQAMAKANIPDGQQLSEAQLASVAGGAYCSLTEWWYQRFTSGAVKC